MARPKQVGKGGRLGHFGYAFVYPSDKLPAMKTKDAGLGIRIDRAQREAFVGACRAHDKPAAQVMRAFMQDYVKQNAPPPAETRKAAP